VFSYRASRECVTLTCDDDHLVIEEHDIWLRERYFLSSTWLVGVDGVDRREIGRLTLR
jgi:hypothetical protein